MMDAFIVHRVIVIASYQGKEYKNPSLLSPDKLRSTMGYKTNTKLLARKGVFTNAAGAQRSKLMYMKSCRVGRGH